MENETYGNFVWSISQNGRNYVLLTKTLKINNLAYPHIHTRLQYTVAYGLCQSKVASQTFEKLNLKIINKIIFTMNLFFIAILIVVIMLSVSSLTESEFRMKERKMYSNEKCCCCCDGGSTNKWRSNMIPPKPGNDNFF